MATTAILDVDGTLVDTNYQHAIAWYRAFREHGVVLPIWQLHRHIGMGGDQIVAALTDDDFERERGDSVRTREKQRYLELIDEVEPLSGARELLERLAAGGLTIVLASSAKEDEVERYLDLLDARDLAAAWTTSADVEATKPEPDLVNAALERAGGAAPEEAVLLGDSTYDCEAAARAKVETIAVRTGGFSDGELREAGAIAVYESLDELLARIDETPLGTRGGARDGLGS